MAQSTSVSRTERLLIGVSSIGNLAWSLLWKLGSGAILLIGLVAAVVQIAQIINFQWPDDAVNLLGFLFSRPMIVAGAIAIYASLTAVSLTLWLLPKPFQKRFADQRRRKEAELMAIADSTRIAEEILDRERVEKERREAIARKKFDFLKPVEELACGDLNFEMVVDGGRRASSNARPMHSVYIPRRIVPFESVEQDHQGTELSEEDLRTAIARGNGFVLIGTPTGGKTRTLYEVLGCVDIWCIMDTCQRLNYAMNNGRKSLNFCAHAQTSTLERRTIAGATSRPSCGWHEVVLLGDCCLSTTVTGTAYISASHAGVKRVYGNECISILCKTPIWSMSSLIAL